MMERRILRLSAIAWLGFAVVVAGCSSVATKRAGVRVTPASDGEQAPVVVISAPLDGRLLYDGEPVDLERLAERALASLARHQEAGHEPTDVRFVVAADRATPESTIIEIMYELNRAGVRHVVFDTLESSMQDKQRKK